jgi:hypothetical protein
MMEYKRIIRASYKSAVALDTAPSECAVARLFTRGLRKSAVALGAAPSEQPGGFLLTKGLRKRLSWEF